MILWTPNLLLISVTVSVISGIPLRTSDYGQDGRIVHYHRDSMAGGYRRHIHYHPTFNRFRAASKDTYFQNHGTQVNPAAVYEVPSHRHYNDALAGRLSLELRTLVDKTNSENNNSADVTNEKSDSGDNNNGKYENGNGKHENGNGKSENGNGKYDNGNGKSDNVNTNDKTYTHEHIAHSVQYRDAPTPPSEVLPTGNVHFPIDSLPHGLHFLNRQTQDRHLQNQGNIISNHANGMTLDLKTLLGGLEETTASPTVTQPDPIMPTGGSLDLGFLLGGMMGTANDNVQNHGHHSHAHGQTGHDHSHQGHDNRHGHQLPNRAHDHGNVAHDHGNVGHDHGNVAHDHGNVVHEHGSVGHGHGNIAHDHGHNMKQDPHRNSVHDKVADSNAPDRLGNLFKGMFNQHSSHNPGDHALNEVNTVPTTETVSSGIFFQKSTVHSRPITKRGVSDGDSVSRYPKTFIDNILNIRIGSTAPPPVVLQTTPPTTYSGYLTTPRYVETQIERLSGVNLDKVRQKDRGIIRKNAFIGSLPKRPETTTPAIVTPTSKELVHLQGIHIMFSNGQQDTSSSIPTVHLTASLSENVNHIMNVASGGSKAKPATFSSITDKITGTAVIRDGHLYLVVYPFGSNKSLDIHYNDTTKHIPMPHNKPVSFSDATKSMPPTTATVRPPSPVKPTVVSLKSSSSSHSSVLPTLAKPTSQTKVSSTGQSDHHHVSTGSDIHSSSHAHDHMPKPEVSTHTHAKSAHSHGHHHHQHHQHSHGSSTPSLTGLRLAEVNDTTLQTLLAPIDKFVSPWNSLNFSKVFPYSAGNSKNRTTNKKTVEEDSEVDIVTFVAKAVDPFNRMKVIIESLVNKTVLNTSNTHSESMSKNTPEARFNFELNLKSPNQQQTNNNQPSITNSNNSEEKAFDKNVPITTENSNKFENKVTDSKPTTDFQTTASPMGDATQENFGMTSAERTTISKSDQNVLYDRNNFETTTVDSILSNRMKSNANAKVLDNRMKAVESNIKTHEGNKQELKQDTKFDQFLHVSENIAPSKAKPRRRPSDFFGTTLSYIPTYTKRHFVRQRIHQETTPTYHNFNLDSQKPDPRKMQTGPRRTSILGSNLQPFVQRTSPNRFRQGLNRGQSEQIISLADILNDIRRIQLHNMQRFNIQNNNFDTMILSEAHQKPVIRTPLVMEGPVIRETSKMRYSDFPIQDNNKPHLQQRRANRITPTPEIQRRFNRDAVFNPNIEAMLVLSVDDIMADQTDLHGAVVLSHRMDPASSNKK